MRTEILTYESDCSERLDRFLAQALSMTRSGAVKLIESGCVSSNGVALSKHDKLKRGDILTVAIPDPVPLDVRPEPIPLDIIYEDDDLLVVNKPKGMVVHPAAGNWDGTLVNALLAHCGQSLSGINGVMRPGILHRIDKDTSGLLMVAKNDKAHQFLAAQIKDHSFVREYEAVVHGVIKEESGKIDAPIGRHPVKRKQMAVTDRASRSAVTYFTVLDRGRSFTHVRLRLETGRTHQIRVHMAYIGHPVAGDRLYGPKKVAPGLDGQCLHAKKLGFVHPTTGQYLEFDSELPAYFQEFLHRSMNHGDL